MAYGGEESVAFEPIDLSSLVEEMLQLLKVSVSKQAILETDLGTGLSAVNGNPSQIRQIVMNLITNASEAIGGRAGVIRVTTARVRIGSDASITGAVNLPPGDYLKLEVSDTGGGMTPEVQTRIFDPFFTTKLAGHGLGLAAVQGIVRGHGGAINVVSSLGQGTRFEVLLPCTNQQVQLIRDIVPQASVGEVAKVTGTVLVVEDEVTLRLAISKMLRKKGLTVIEAADGSAAVDLFRANEPDIAVVLLDVTLPGMSGPEVFAELGRIRPDIKVIVTTAYGRETTLPICGGQQSWAFIRKPYQLNALWSLILAACRKTE
jgi:CheY-like chemotaxis protein